MSARVLTGAAARASGCSRAVRRHGGQGGRHRVLVRGQHGGEVLAFGGRALLEVLVGEREAEPQGQTTLGVRLDHVLDPAPLDAADALERDPPLRFERHPLPQRHALEEDVAHEPAVAAFEDVAGLHLRHERQGVVRLQQQPVPHLVLIELGRVRVVVDQHRAADLDHGSTPFRGVVGEVSKY
jgi:hypothetical protein